MTTQLYVGCFIIILSMQSLWATSEKAEINLCNYSNGIWHYNLLSCQCEQAEWLFVHSHGCQKLFFDEEKQECFNNENAFALFHRDSQQFWDCVHHSTKKYNVSFDPSKIQRQKLLFLPRFIDEKDFTFFKHETFYPRSDSFHLKTIYDQDLKTILRQKSEFFLKSLPSVWDYHKVFYRKNDFYSLPIKESFTVEHCLKILDDVEQSHAYCADLLDFYHALLTGNALAFQTISPTTQCLPYCYKQLKKNNLFFEIALRDFLPIQRTIELFFNDSTHSVKLLTFLAANGDITGHLKIISRLIESDEAHLQESLAFYNSGGDLLDREIKSYQVPEGKSPLISEGLPRILVVDGGINPRVPFLNNLFFKSFAPSLLERADLFLQRFSTATDIEHGTNVVSVILNHVKSPSLFFTSAHNLRDLTFLDHLISRLRPHIVNLSFEFSKEVSQCLIQFERLIGKYPQTLFISASGNEGVFSQSTCPSLLQKKFKNLISVAGHDVHGEVDLYSNRGEQSNFALLPMAAPCLKINSSGKYQSSTCFGTSFATATMTGILGKLLQLYPLLPIEKVKHLLQASSTKSRQPVESQGPLDLELFWNLAVTWFRQF